uniref:C2H2-type domain-containing protein n=1 Tax=Acrobeloides nanus TaxID=290746 RepID=A0A914BVS6_9BILA
MENLQLLKLFSVRFVQKFILIAHFDISHEAEQAKFKLTMANLQKIKKIVPRNLVSIIRPAFDENGEPAQFLNMILTQSQNKMASDNIGSGALLETGVKLGIASKESLFTENVQESVSMTKQLSVVANTSSEPEATALETSVKYLIRAPAPETPTSTTLEQEIRSMLDQVTKMATQKTNKVLKNPVTSKQKDKIFDNAASFIESSLESEKKRRGVKRSAEEKFLETLAKSPRQDLELPQRVRVIESLDTGNAEEPIMIINEDYSPENGIPDMLQNEPGPSTAPIRRTVNRKDHKTRMSLSKLISLICPHCSMAFENRCKLTRHLLDHKMAENPYRCPQPNCLQSYDNRHKFRNHLQRCHPNLSTSEVDLYSQQGDLEERRLQLKKEENKRANSEDAKANSQKKLINTVNINQWLSEANLNKPQSSNSLPKITRPFFMVPPGIRILQPTPKTTHTALEEVPVLKDHKGKQSNEDSNPFIKEEPMDSITEEFMAT